MKLKSIAQSSFQTENFVNTSEKIIKTRNWILFYMNVCL